MSKALRASRGADLKEPRSECASKATQLGQACLMSHLLARETGAKNTQSDTRQDVFYLTTSSLLCFSTPLPSGICFSSDQGFASPSIPTASCAILAFSLPSPWIFPPFLFSKHSFRITQTFWECSVKGLLSITLVTLPAPLQTTYKIPSPTGFQQALGSLYGAVALLNALLPIPHRRATKLVG